MDAVEVLKSWIRILLLLFLTGVAVAERFLLLVFPLLGFSSMVDHCIGMYSLVGSSLRFELLFLKLGKKLKIQIICN